MRNWPQGSLMAGLSEPCRQVLLKMGTERRFVSGDVLMLQGGTDTFALLILDGCVRVTGTTQNGETTLLAYRVNGDMVGELAAQDGEPRTATVTAALPTTALLITSADFRRTLAEHRSLADAVHDSVIRKLRMASQYRIVNRSNTPRTQVAEVLYILMRHYGVREANGTRIDVPLTDADLSAMTGLSMASVGRAQRLLRESGAILTSYRTITIKDLTLLYQAVTENHTGI